MIACVYVFVLFWIKWTVKIGISLKSVAFMEISRNRLAALKARQVAYASRTISWVFRYAPPSG